MKFFQRQSMWVWVIMVLFVVVNVAYLGTIPGLMGDEGSEGENVYQLLQSKKIVLVGERSYIGPFIDYIRVPFILLFGYNALALRLVMVVFSVVLLLMAIWLADISGLENGGLVAVVAALFSPVFIFYQRLGWAITLIPFFAVLMIVLSATRLRFKWWWVGVAAGVGLSNHIIFVGALAGVLVGLAVLGIRKVLRREIDVRKLVLGLVLAVAGFGLGFGSQALVLMKMTEDQGNPAAVAEVARGRWRALPQLLPMIVSGSSYVASYTGGELKHEATIWVTGVIFVLAGAAWVMNWRRAMAWVWGLGTVGQLWVLMVMIDRFTLRYFVVLALSLWAMAGWGAWSILRIWLKEKKWSERLAAALAVGLTVWTVWQAGWPYYKTGGSANEFSIGNRTNLAIDLARTVELESCVTGLGKAWSENIHVRNRLIYLSRGERGFTVMEEEKSDEAEYRVDYCLNEQECEDANVPERCRGIKFFCVSKNQELRIKK